MDWLDNWETMPIFVKFVLAIFIINVIATLIIVIWDHKNSGATMTWIVLIFVFPIVGIILYLFFSQVLIRKKIFQLTREEEKSISGSLKRQSEEMKNGVFNFSTPPARLWKDMIHLNQIYSRAYYTQNNKMSIITDGNGLMDAFIEDIKNAKETINIMFFIVKNDEAGEMLIKVLAQKAREGVEVRFLVDAMGSRHINDVVLNEYLLAGGKRAYFFPPKLKVINLKFNYRNHRKLAIVDGKIGYIGGFNIAKEYLGKKKKFGNWRDTHIRLMGGCVQDINARFLLDWRFASREKVALSQAYYSGMIEAGHTGIQIVSCGPDTPREEVKRAYMKMITSAEKNIYLQTPYFVPDASILESLKMAAQSGVDVRLMIPCMPDHVFVYWATYSYVGELINSGGRVFIYDDGFLHAKTLVVDTEVASIGSANFDRRSFSLNFESNALIYDQDEAAKLEKIFEEDMESCHELTKNLYDNRSWAIRTKEAFARLISDIL
ncbi:MAG: cardiolipin synthase [Anaerovoracaceae bacterium]